jgi:hypothetical protein
MQLRSRTMITTLAAVSVAAGGWLGWQPALLIAQTVSGISLMRQTPAQAEAKSAGCLSCHRGIEPMHESDAVKLGCTDCHGGNAGAALASTSPTAEEYERVKNEAHVHPRHPEAWSRDGRRSAANPERSYTLLNAESPEFVRFINPGDLRIAPETCGVCHVRETNNVPKSTMATASVFWAAAAYANGILGFKYPILGENYTRDGEPGMIKETEPLTAEQIRKGARPFLLPLPRWELTQPGEYFRAFERGGIFQNTTPPEVGNPNPFEEPGKPDIRLSNRGRGTGSRISPALINLHKTRLNDPHLSFLGTNDHPGDYRSSGCTACHVVYANDRDPLHSGPWAQFGHQGLSATGDPTIPKDEKGHPIRHRLTRSIPTSQCMSCHMHQPNSFVNTYLGYTMWDYETDAELMFPKQQRYPTSAERRASLDRNPEGAAVRGLWTDPEFLARVSELNPRAKHTQFADYHGHGWIFQAVFNRDRKGRLLDSEGAVVPFDDAEKFSKAVHLRDIHLEKGMHCSDCHFAQDNHGDGNLYGEYSHSIEIECEDCHGTVASYTNLRTTGPAAPEGGTDLTLGTTPFGRRRFAWREGKLFQRSMMNKDMEWEVVQVRDTITAGNEHYNEKSHYAKTIRRDGRTWGNLPPDHVELAHSSEEITCYACHSSWITSCFGCHLPQDANEKSEMIRYEGTTTRNYASYNPQVVRADIFMLGKHGDRKGNKIAPVRSSSALVLSSTQANRQRIYIQQPTISAPGFNGQAFNPHVPHTVRGRETKGCNDCHVSAANDNNAWMAQLLLQGTNWVNFIGRFAYVAAGESIEAVAVTEWEEPQAVIGSSLHQIVYPDFHAKHEKLGRELEVAHHHHAHGSRSIQLRGEYIYSAEDHFGLVVYDAANVDNKDFSERIVSSPFTSFGQRPTVKTKHATAVALPTNMPMAPGRKTLPENREQPIHPIYRYAFISDSEEGVVLVDVTTMTDGNPENNFLGRALTFNPGGALTGATNLTIAGNYAYVVADRGLVIVDFSTPLEPQIVATVPEISKGTAVAVQFRYAFVTDAAGLAVVDITDPRRPTLAARLPLDDARNVYVARTYAWIAAGKNGIAIVDVERPDRPRLERMYDAGGRLDDVYDVKVGSTNASLFAYVANGRHGLEVLQLTSPATTPGFAGFSPPTEPRLIAHRHVKGVARAISKGLDRDRAADESGNQVAIFNRLGARPMTLQEMQRLYLRNGALFTVNPGPETPPLPLGESIRATKENSR